MVPDSKPSLAEQVIWHLDVMRQNCRSKTKLGFITPTMEAIAKQINNPEWWFTVVLMGLIIGVVAAYAKDWLTVVLSAVSSKYRVYAERRFQTRAAAVLLLASEPSLLLIEYVRCILILVGTVALLAASYFFVAWNVLRTNFPDIDPVTKLMALDQVHTWLGISRSSETQNLLTQLVFGVPGLALWNHFLSKYFLCERARKQLRTKSLGRLG